MNIIDFKSKRYDELYDYISNEIEKINPCEIRVNTKGKLTCKGIESKLYKDRQTLCCSKITNSNCHNIFKTDCKHLTIEGCSVKSLSCKLWFCESAWLNIFKNRAKIDVMNFVIALQTVNQIIRLHQIPAISRHSKSENFSKL